LRSVFNLIDQQIRHIDFGLIWDSIRDVICRSLSCQSQSSNFPFFRPITNLLFNQRNSTWGQYVLFADQSNQKQISFVFYPKHSGGARISFWAGIQSTHFICGSLSFQIQSSKFPFFQPITNLLSNQKLSALVSYVTKSWWFWVTL
jgi:hypothetical protein